MPRTEGYLSPFDSLINRAASRNAIMAAGVTAALAAPFSALMADGYSNGSGSDWPEFRQWLADAIALDAHYEATRALDDATQYEEIHDREDWQTEEMGRLCRLAQDMAARPILTERHLAMLVALAVWSAESRNGANSFDVTALRRHEDEIATDVAHYVLRALAQRAATILPSVPFYARET